MSLRGVVGGCWRLWGLKGTLFFFRKCHFQRKFCFPGPKYFIFSNNVILLSLPFLTVLSSFNPLKYYLHDLIIIYYFL
jgi:hypothetical protein